MTNVEFQTKLNAMYAKHPMIAKSNPKSLNELMYVLRVDGDRDYSISDNEGGCIPSVRETFVPSRDLARKVTNVCLEEFEDEEYGTYGAVFVDFDDNNE